MPPIPNNVVRLSTMPEEPEPASYADVEEVEELLIEDEDPELADTDAAVDEEFAAGNVASDAAAASGGERSADGETGATAAAVAKPKFRRQPKPAEPVKHRQSAKQRFEAAGAAGPLAIFAAVAAGSWLLWRVLRGCRSRPAAAAAPARRSAPALVGKLDLPPAPAPTPPAAPHPLAGATFAIADL